MAFWEYACILWRGQRDGPAAAGAKAWVVGEKALSVSTVLGGEAGICMRVRSEQWIRANKSGPGRPAKVS